jgi:hypothetical protein
MAAGFNFGHTGGGRDGYRGEVSLLTDARRRSALNNLARSFQRDILQTVIRCLAAERVFSECL